MSKVATEAPVMLIIRNFGRRRMRLPGDAVRSRIVNKMSQSAIALAASSSVANASGKNVTSASRAMVDQSALVHALFRIHRRPVQRKY
jgi:hypothetical protein